MESERWSLYHIPDIEATEGLKYWTFVEDTGEQGDLLGVCVKVYDDGSIDFLGKESNMTNRDGVTGYDAEITCWHPTDCSTLPVEIHLTDANGNINTYRRIDLGGGGNSNVF